MDGKKFLAVLLITALGGAALNASYTAYAQGITVFPDVSADSAYFIPVSYLREKGFVNGYADGLFHPDDLVNRSQALAMVMRVAGVAVPAPDGTVVAPEKPFKDVYSRNWFFYHAIAGRTAGIVSGYDNGQYFRPYKAVTLAEALRMLFKAAKTDISRQETESGAWYAADIAYAISRTLILQQPNGATFDPNAALTRGGLALILYRFMKTAGSAAFGYASWYGDGLSQIVIENGDSYHDRNLTAAHRTLPMGTVIRATNMENGKYVDVIVNDRGPYVIGRVIDLSKTAFSQIANAGQGVIMVAIEQMPDLSN